MMDGNGRFLAGAACAVVLALLLAGRGSGQGIALNGVGPLNRAMAGASTAAPLDAMGAIHWNPATLTALPSSELSVGLELLLPTEEVSSRYEANSLGPGLPPILLAGSTDGEPGVTPIPNVGFVECSDDSPWTFGLGILSVAGFTVNYPASTTNPILTPQPPYGMGMGRVEGRAEILQLVPTVAVRLTDRLSLGGAPTVTMARVAATPAFLAPPDDANQDTFATYGSATGTRYHWGGGFQVGAYYQTDSCWNFGVSFKSPQWLEDFRFRSEDELGRPVVHRFDLDYPLIVSLGASYSGWDRTLVAIDVRYVNYRNTDGFGDRGFLPNGAVAGLAWDNVWSVSVGLHHHLSRSLAVQLGYWYAQNPIHGTNSSFNVASPLISQHAVSAGLSWWIRQPWQLHVTYVHGFQSSVSGPLQSPLGPIPGTSIQSTVSADALAMGISVKF